MEVARDFGEGKRDKARPPVVRPLRCVRGCAMGERPLGLVLVEGGRAGALEWPSDPSSLFSRLSPPPTHPPTPAVWLDPSAYRGSLWPRSRRRPPPRDPGGGSAC